jgi:hypothetical protein
MYGNSREASLDVFVERLPAFAPALADFVRLVRFHLAPLTCHTSLRRRIEAALALHYPANPDSGDPSLMWISATYPGAPAKSPSMSAASPRRCSSGYPRVSRHRSRPEPHQGHPRAKPFQETTLYWG